MKFNWGTGIFLFLVVFLTACGVFIYFAMTQQVNLVHKDYYEKGVDYSEQMKVDARSKKFARSFNTKSTEQFFLVNINKDLATKIDSGTIHMYRPSDSSKDIKTDLKAGSEKSFTGGFKFDKRALLSGRYILKITWYMEGVKYEVDRPVDVQ